MCNVKIPKIFKDLQFGAQSMEQYHDIWSMTIILTKELFDIYVQWQNYHR